MKVLIYDSKSYDKDYFTQANFRFGYDLHFFDSKLSDKTAHLAKGYEAICCFVNDHLNSQVLEQLHQNGVKKIALRCAGFNNLDLESAKILGFQVSRVPSYSPHAVAEHAFSLLMTLNRKTHRAYNRVREGNFSLHGLIGFDIHQKTIGIIGTGRIGQAFARIALGFGANVIAHDPGYQDKDLKAIGVRYTGLIDILKGSDIVSLHLPLNPKTYHLIGKEKLWIMKPGAVLINTSRGGLVDTKGLIEVLKKKHIGGACLDVYEEEQDYFFSDLSNQIIDDDTLARLLTFPNVVLTSHQGFLTHEALNEIAKTTLSNLSGVIAPNGKLT